VFDVPIFVHFRDERYSLDACAEGPGQRQNHHVGSVANAGLQCRSGEEELEAVAWLPAQRPSAGKRLGERMFRRPVEGCGMSARGLTPELSRVAPGAGFRPGVPGFSMRATRSQNETGQRKLSRI
jgi:hypothetical protein